MVQQKLPRLAEALSQMHWEIEIWPVVKIMRQTVTEMEPHDEAVSGYEYQEFQKVCPRRPSEVELSSVASQLQRAHPMCGSQLPGTKSTQTALLYMRVAPRWARDVRLG